MNRDARARRDLLITIEAVAGRSHAEIAERHGVCVKTVGRAIERTEDSSARNGENGTAELREYWLRLEHAIEELGLERLEARKARDRVRAMEVQLSLMGERREALTALGLIPTPTTDGHREREVGAECLGGQLIRAAREDGLGVEVEEWLRQRVGELGGSSVSP